MVSLLSKIQDDIEDEAERERLGRRAALPDCVRARLDSVLWVALRFEKSLSYVGLNNSAIRTICSELEWCGADWRTRGVDP